jgi:SNF2 family DNA or RNA helicase
MKQVYKPRKYQEFTTQQIIDNGVVLQNGRRGSGPFLDMGLGKTVSTLTAVAELLRRNEGKKVLIVAPKRVAEQVWPAEVEKWAHLGYIRVSVVTGSERARTGKLGGNANVFTLGVDNIAWLVAKFGGKLPFDMLVIDESSGFKSASSQRFKALRQALPSFKRVVILTGTPRGNKILDLWPQIYLLDSGERLGPTVTGFRNRYFTPGASKNHVVYEYNLKKGNEFEGEDINERIIYEKISDICFSMKSADWLELPTVTVTDVWVDLTPPLLQQYKDFKKEQVLQLLTDTLSAPNAAALTGKLLQFASGAIYKTDSREWVDIHNLKLQAFAEDVEALNGSPLLVFYQFQHDAARIKKLFPYARLLQTNQDIEDWNNGKIELLLAHPKSAGHGLNLQFGGNNLAWFGCPWSLELYLQANKRIDRPGQNKPVFIRRYLTNNTFDMQVVNHLAGHENSLNSLMDAVKAMIEEIRCGI